MAASRRLYRQFPNSSLRRAAADLVLAFFWHGINLSLLVPLLGNNGGAPADSLPALDSIILDICLLLEILALLFTFSPGFRRWWGRAAERLEQRGFILVSAALLFNVWLWSLFDHQPLFPVFCTFNLVVIASLSVRQQPPSTERAWVGIWIILLVALGILGLVSASQYPGEHPGLDEVGWTAYAVNYLNTGQVYYRLMGSDPYAITPGVGWWVVIYAGWVQVFGISLASARGFMLIVYLLGIALTGWAGKRLYGPRVGWLAAILFAGSAYVVQFRWLRPEFLMMLVVALFIVLYSAKRRRPLAHFGAGLIAVLSMEIHGSGLAVLTAIGLVYATDFLGDLLARRRPEWSVYLAAAAGAGVGGVWFVVMHILILGDTQLYFEILATRRFLTGLRYIQVLWLWWEFSADSPLEALLLIPAALALLLRRTRPDWLLLRLMVFFVLTYALLVPFADRYWVGWMPLPVLAFAALLTHGVQRHPSASTPRTLHPLWSTVAVTGVVMLVVLRSASSASFSDPFPAHTLNARDERIRAVIADQQAVVVGDLESYWSMLDYPNFYVTAAEGEARYDPEIRAAPYSVWSTLNPDVVTRTEYPNFPLELDKLRLYLRDQEFRLVDEFVIDGVVTRIWFRKDYQPPEVATSVPRALSPYRPAFG